MTSKYVLLALSICICIGCQRKARVDNKYSSVEDIPQQKIVFSRAGTNCYVSGSGSFVVVRDTVFFVDYYYDYNDGKELSVFSFNQKWRKRLIRMYKSGPIELSLNNRRLGVFRRAWKSSYKEYSLDSLYANKESCLDSISIPSVDHMLKVDSFYICAKIEGGGPHLLDIYDDKCRLVGSVDPYDGLLDSIPSQENRYTLGQGLLSYNKEGGYVAFSSTFLGIIRLYDIKNNRLVHKKNIYIGREIPDVLKFNATNGTTIYSDGICSDGEYTYILYKYFRVVGKSKFNYILRLDKNGEIDCLKANIDLVQIYATNGRLYGIAKYGKLGNILVTAKLPKK